MISDYLARPSRHVRNIKQVMASAALDSLNKELIYVAASVDGATGRQLAGFDDGEVHASAIDDKMLAGLNAAKALGQTLPKSEV